VSPQNVLVGVDGVARVTDFGIAKCVEASDPGTSRETLKGKVGYMAPEYVRGQTVDRRVDVFALGVVLWEALQGKRLFRGQSDAETLERLLSMTVPPASEGMPELAVLDAAVAQALARDPAKRHATTEAMGRAIELAATPHGLVAGASEVGRFVRETESPRLEERRRALREAKPEVEPQVAQERSPTVAEPVRRSPLRKTPLVLAVAGTVALAGAGAAALARSHPAAAPLPSAVAVMPDPAPVPLAPSSTLPIPVAAPSVPSPPSATRAPARGPARSTPHRPPPNPYATSP
jgi:eukaryotic-like serine/threonine-protein kinase